MKFLYTILSLLKSSRLGRWLIEDVNDFGGPCACKGKYPEATHRPTFCARRVA